MTKEKQPSKIFKKNVKSMISSNDNSNQNFMMSAGIIRAMGQECFSSAPTNIWGKTKNGIEGKMELLDDSKINSSNGLLVLGFGDAYGNGCYGAGPTRDMRRAYYTPMVLTLQPNVKIGKKDLLFNSNSKYIREFSKSVDSLELSDLNSDCFKNSNIKPLLGGVFNKEAIFNIFASNIRKSKRDYFCDLGILLKSEEVSGHNFIPQEQRNDSPLYGPLSLAMGGKDNLIKGPVKELYDFLGNKFNKFKEITEKFPLQDIRKSFPMVYVYGS